jgi:hypothetical protein
MSGGVDSSVALSLLASPHLPPGISPELAQKLPFTLPNHPSSSASFASSINPHGQIPLNPSRDLDISAIFMRNWSPLLSESDHPSWETDCAWEKDWEDVQRVCKVWDVPVRLVSQDDHHTSMGIGRELEPRQLETFFNQAANLSFDHLTLY